MARRKDHTREELKSLILEAAWKIIKSHGSSALTARAIASEIGYTVGTIYNVFQDMNDLILQINLRTIKILLEVLNNSECNNPSNSPMQNAKSMAALYANFAHDYKPYWLLLFTHILPAERFIDPEYRNIIDTLFQPLERIITPIYPSSGAEQEIKIAARSLWASVHGIIYLQETQKLLLLPDKTGAKKITDYLIETFFAGLEA